MGHEEEAPYDAIHVGAAAPTVPQAVSLHIAALCVAGDQSHIVPIQYQLMKKYQGQIKNK